MTCYYSLRNGAFDWKNPVRDLRISNRTQNLKKRILPRISLTEILPDMDFQIWIFGFPIKGQIEKTDFVTDFMN